MLPTDPWPTLCQLAEVGCCVLTAEDERGPAAGFLFIPAEKPEVHFILARPVGPEAFRLFRAWLRARGVLEVWTYVASERLARFAECFGFNPRFLSQDGRLWMSVPLSKGSPC